jgi:8-oxo-dGTP diphosphatase
MNRVLPVVAGALIDDQGQVLVQKRADGSESSGYWEFPGGKIEGGETPQDALVRELKEELSIVVDKADLCAACFSSTSQLNQHLVLLLFICRKWEGELTPLVASEVKWISPESLDRLSMLPADVALIRALRALV